MNNKLNLGCGNRRMKGYVNLDLLPNKGVDIVWDMNNTPYPFTEDTFIEVCADHSLEHCYNFHEIMVELHRICKPKAKLFIEVPYYVSITALATPEHKTFFTTKSFNYFKPTHGQHFIGGVSFRVLEVKLMFSKNRYATSKFIESIVNKMQSFYERFLFFFLPMQIIKYKLEVVK